MSCFAWPLSAYRVFCYLEYVYKEPFFPPSGLDFVSIQTHSKLTLSWTLHYLQAHSISKFAIETWPSIKSWLSVGILSWPVTLIFIGWNSSSGALVNLEQLGPNHYRANETALPDYIKHPRSGKTIDWGFGPLKVIACTSRSFQTFWPGFQVTGYLDLEKKEIGVNVTVVGISIGNISGSLVNGVTVEVNLLVAKGSLRFYLKDGDDLYVHVNLKIPFDGSYDDDYNIPFV